MICWGQESDQGFEGLPRYSYRRKTMIGSTPPKARLIAEIPVDRVDLIAGDGVSRPVVGDIVELEQGFTGPNGEPMGIVICFNDDRSVRWVADVMDSEIELIPRNFFD
jgi:hypothetical protein